jgi:hypothetical protein
MATNTLRDYRRMSLENKRKFDSWVNASGVLGLILFLGIMSMAVATITTSPTPSSVAAGVVVTPALAQPGATQ